MVEDMNGEPRQCLVAKHLFLGCDDEGLPTIGLEWSNKTAAYVIRTKEDLSRLIGALNKAMASTVWPHRLRRGGYSSDD